MNSEQELASLRTHNEQLSNQIARLGYEAVFIFGAPVALFAFLYKTNMLAVSLPVFGIICLCLCVLSTFVFIQRLTPLSAQARILEKRIQELVAIVEPKELHD